MSTPTPRTYAAKIKSGFAAIPDGFYDHARGLETELAALTAERDQLRAEVKSCGELSCDECNARTAALTAERDQLRSEVERLNALGSWAHTCIHHTDEERKAWVACPCCAIARAERAEAEVKRLGHLEAVLRSCAFDKDGTAWKTVCGWWSKKYDAVERQMSDNATRAELADAELATERARLDWVFHNCKVTRDDFTVHDREDLGVAMKEGAK